jgi:ureidoglycolate dehydrogenase (NAD+)
VTPAPRVAVQDLTAFCIEALLKTGMREDDARIASEALVTTDLLGVFTHGTKNLRLYVRRILAGGLDPKAVPQVVREGPSWAVIDGHSAMAMVSSCRAMATAIEKASTTGVAYVGVRDSCHFGAAGFYALMAARNDMIGLSMSNDTPSMTAPGARGHILGTNPFAVAIPAGKEYPILLDIAMSTVAGSKVYQALSQGKPIPNTWIVDGDGLPTTDASVYPHSASMLPMSGHKGYGLALLIETLSALLSGAMSRGEVGSWMWDDGSKPTGHGHAFIAVNVGAIEPIDRFKERIDNMIRSIRQAPKAKGSDRIFLPGEMEFERMDQARAQGIPLPSDAVDSLKALAEQLGLDASVLFGPPAKG